MTYFAFLVLSAALVHSCTTTLADEQSLADWLWDETAAQRYQALNSTLIRGLQEVILDPSQFGGYMVQDSVYCYEGMLSWREAADRTANETVKAFISEEADSWQSYADSLFRTWHIDDYKGIALGEAAGNYIVHLRMVAGDPSLAPEYAILAFTPCAKLWPWLGTQIGAGTGDFGIYTSWVYENLGWSESYKKYEEYVEWAYQRGDITREKALQIFSTSMNAEVAFFNSVQLPSRDESIGDKNACYSHHLSYIILAFVLCTQWI